MPLYLLVLCALLAAAPVFAQDAPSALLPEPGFLTGAVDRVTRMKGDEATRPRDGFYPEMGHMITGAGWISLGPGYRHRVFSNRAVVDLSTAVSWRAYKIAQARFEFPRLADDHVSVGAQALWKDFTQISYFGRGRDSLEALRSDYRLKTTNVVGYATVRPRKTVSLTGRAGWLDRPALSASAGPFDRDLPDTMAQFPDEPAAQLARQPRFLHGELALISDTRDHPGHPTSGALQRAAWIGFRDTDDGHFTFERYELDWTQFVPAAAVRSVIAVHAGAVFSSTAADREIPFYLLPSLGGNNTLRGFDDYRFHDRHLLVVNAESRWALMPHVDAAAFADAGNVASRVGDLDLERISYGVGARVHTGTSTIARFDVARSAEGWQLLLRLNDPLRLARLSRRTAPMPFVP